MALDIRIQQATKTFRDGDLAAMDEADVRAIAQDYGIDGWETTPLVTLREEIAQQWRNDAREATYPLPQLSDNPDFEAGNPGNDNPDLPDFPEA
ncbi:MAG TPA: hypothetical protein VFX15_03065 [Actinomycetes bacterium]|nr:hypothetical protein [Actinomycetes bacterium]